MRQWGKRHDLSGVILAGRLKSGHEGTIEIVIDSPGLPQLLIENDIWTRGDFGTRTTREENMRFCVPSFKLLEGIKLKGKTGLVTAAEDQCRQELGTKDVVAI